MMKYLSRDLIRLYNSLEIYKNAWTRLGPVKQNLKNDFLNLLRLYSTAI